MQHRIAVIQNGDDTMYFRFRYNRISDELQLIMCVIRCLRGNYSRLWTGYGTLSRVKKHLPQRCEDVCHVLHLYDDTVGLERIYRLFYNP